MGIRLFVRSGVAPDTAKILLDAFQRRRFGERVFPVDRERTSPRGLFGPAEVLRRDEVVDGVLVG